MCLLVKEHNTINSPANNHLLKNPSRCNYQFTRHKQTNMLNDTRLTQSANVCGQTVDNPEPTARLLNDQQGEEGKRWRGDF